MSDHPLSKFLFCPVCGSSDFYSSSEKSKRCGACGFELFLNPSAATVAVIVNSSGELLVTRRAKEPARGTLDLPGGFSDIGETSEEGVAREVLEETGLRVVHAEFLFSLPNSYVYSGFDIPTLDMFYRCEVENPDDLKAADDAAEVFWIAFEDIQPDDFGLNSIQAGVERLIKQQKRKKAQT